MIERIFELMERLVFAAELLAKAVAEAGEPSLRAKTATLTPTGEDLEKEPARGALGTGINYDDIVARGAAGRNALLQMCHERNIEVPPRTRTDTLVKQLKAWDLANPDGPAEELENTKTLDSGKGIHDDSDPFGEKTSGEIVDSDPFGLDLPVETALLTIEELRGALQKLMASKGKDAVIKILAEVGGVAKLKDLPEDKFSAVMEAIAKNG